MDTSPTPRPLTYDEKRASEAAFLGLPVRPAAYRVHVNIVNRQAAHYPGWDFGDARYSAIF
jgi:hypothetical protein